MTDSGLDEGRKNAFGRLQSDTRVIEAGRRPEWAGRTVNVPVHRASTILFESTSALAASDGPRDGSFYYGRHGTPTQWSFAEALTALEPGAAGTRLFPSGVAAASVALLSVLRPGDELLMVDSCYDPTRAFCDGFLKQFGVSTVYYNPLVGRGISELFGERTRAVFMESPGSLTIEVQDVPAICAEARGRGIATLIDNTWATPLYFSAIAAGADLSILSCTKYVAGHSDLMMGSVTAAPKYWEPLARTSRALGQHVSPDDSYLAARGLRTLAVRLERHQASALKIAEWLEGRSEVEAVLHPALPAFSGHPLWKRDFKGASGLFSFVLRGSSEERRARFVDALEYFGIGYSWGGYESLVVPADPTRSLGSAIPSGSLVRLSIGLEHPDDLIADLERALEV